MNAAAAQGHSQVQAQAEALGRSLFASQVSDSSITNQQFVLNLCEGFLQRGPDTGGLNFWTSVAGSHGRQFVLDSFATSPAFRELSGTLYREAFWLVADHLGTPRMVADKSGSLAGIKRHDYLPYGEELYTGAGGRLPAQGYSAIDNVRQKFTAKERDEETGLDYFLARYYSSAQGRFASPDEFAGGPDELFDFADDAADNPTFYADLANPQSLNKYQYAYNNPLRYTDPDGHCPICPTAERVAGRIVASPTGQRIINVVGGAATTVIVAASGAIEKLAESAGRYDTTCPECGWDRNPIADVSSPNFYQKSGNNSGHSGDDGEVAATRSNPGNSSQGSERGSQRRNIEVPHPSRKRAREAGEHPHPGKKKPTPPKSDTKKRREYEEQQKYRYPERHRNSKHSKSHFHDRDKSNNRKVNRHHTYPK